MVYMLLILPAFALWLGGALLIIRYRAMSYLGTSKEGKLDGDDYAFAIVWPVILFIALLFFPIWGPILIFTQLIRYLDLDKPKKKEPLASETDNTKKGKRHASTPT